jgi:hypothetical protein
LLAIRCARHRSATDALVLHGRASRPAAPATSRGQEQDRTAAHAAEQATSGSLEDPAMRPRSGDAHPAHAGSVAGRRARASVADRKTTRDGTDLAWFDDGELR